MTGVGDINGLVKDLNGFLDKLEGRSSADMLKDITTVFSKVTQFSTLIDKARDKSTSETRRRNEVITGLLGKINSMVFDKIVLIKSVLKNDNNGENKGVWESNKEAMQERFPELKKGMGGRFEPYRIHGQTSYASSTEAMVEEQLRSSLGIKVVSVEVSKDTVSEATEETKSDHVETVTVWSKVTPEYWSYDKLNGLNQALKQDVIPVGVLEDLLFFITSVDHTDSASLPKIASVLSGVKNLNTLFHDVDGYTPYTGKRPKEESDLYAVRDKLISKINNARTAASYTDNLWKTYGSKMEMLLNNNLPWKTRVFSEEQHRSSAVGITTTL